jgi:hypothetical protein
VFFGELTMTMETRTTQVTLVPIGERTFSDRGFTVEIDDEGEGEYVVVMENATGTKVRINPDEWRPLEAAIDKMVDLCRDYDK